MQDVSRLLEQVAFESVESRLAAALLELARDGLVQATQAALAARIGSAREVVYSILGVSTCPMKNS